MDYEILYILCWPSLSPQMVGTLLAAPATAKVSVVHMDSALG